MRAIFQKELKHFFGSLAGYLSIGIFLLVTGLFNWVFPETNIIDFGYAHLDGFFGMAPYILVFLIPAITMRSFADEMQSGTYELLATRPLTDMQIIGGKYVAALVLVFISILPTALYFLSLYLLASPTGNVDTGGIMGSYFGLCFLAAVFCAIGIFASSITNNQIVAFITAVFVCFFLYQAFDYLSQLGTFFGKYDYLVENIGLNAHYNSMSRGVIDSRDVVYFLTVISLFLLLTRVKIESRKWR